MFEGRRSNEPQLPPRVSPCVAPLILRQAPLDGGGAPSRPDRLAAQIVAAVSPVPPSSNVSRNDIYRAAGLGRAGPEGSPRPLLIVFRSPTLHGAEAHLRSPLSERPLTGAVAPVPGPARGRTPSANAHFNLIAPDGPVTDRKGIEVADFDRALDEALSALREMSENGHHERRALLGNGPLNGGRRALALLCGDGRRQPRLEGAERAERP